MSKSAKLAARLRTIPADFTWDELVTALKSVDFDDISDKGGSYRTFLHKSGRKINLHKPHPNKIMKKYALREVVQILDEMGL